jgi:hypothetical protein
LRSDHVSGTCFMQTTMFMTDGRPPSADMRPGTLWHRASALWHRASATEAQG